MKRTLFFFTLFIGVSMVLLSCSQAKNAEKYSDAFLQKLLKHDFDAAKKMLDASLQSTSNIDAELEYIGENDEMGKLISFKKSMGFNTNISNGVTTVELSYTLTYENDTRDYTITIVDDGSGYKILSMV